MGAWLIASWLVVGASPAGTVRVLVPERSPCASEEVQGALRARIPDLEVRAGEAQAGEVALRLTPASDGWSIEVRAPGQRPLERRLGGADCLALSTAAALMTERYLQSIAWQAPPAVVEVLPPPPPPARWEAVAGLGLGLGVGGLTGVAPTAHLELGLRVEGWLVEVEGAYLGSGQLALLAGTQPPFLFHHSAALALAGGRLLPLGPGAVRLAVAPTVALFWVGSEAPVAGAPDPLPHRRTALAALPSVAVQAGYEAELVPRLTLGVRVQARLHLGTAAFAVEGYTPSLATHLVEGEAELTVGYRFF